MKTNQLLNNQERIMQSCRQEWTSRGVWSNLLLTAAAMGSDQVVQSLKTSKNGAYTASLGSLLHHATILQGITFLLKMLAY